ncbi:hypothetical protein PRZ48_013760 [Zasmidium cellare]|uniref:NAD(P)-binding protein n=1 Tax=Zasmidium cellare TaxID=395010 RepID=A0ABR0E1Y2_ZASCE|nr:hypothetical protein PRZ48_013760 [Zasmidium cellare]
MAEQAFKFPAWSGVNFTSTLHSSIPPSLRPENQSLPDGLVICITGASRGIGAETAKIFAQTGAAGLILTARTTEALQDTAAACFKVAKDKALKISTLATIVDSEEDVKALATHIRQEYGRLDVLVNNAGVVSTDATAFSKIEDMNLSQVQDIMNINYIGRFLTTKYLLPLLKTSQAKTVIDISSMGAHFTGGGPVAFNISTLAGNRLTEWIADTYGSEGILCYSVHPGMVGNARPPPGLPQEVMDDKCVDSADLCGAFLVWLLRERPEWLSGRYLSANWDVEELVGRKGEIVERDMLRMRMVV